MQVWAAICLCSAAGEQQFDGVGLLQLRVDKDVTSANSSGFALQELGPFPLATASVDFSKLNLRKGTWKTQAMKKPGKIAMSMAMDCAGSDYWLGATSAMWAYPQPTGTSDNALRVFENYGGFILLDDDGQVMQSLEIARGDTDPLMTMYFDEPFAITEEEWDRCVNPAKITIQGLWDAGARQYCWETKHNMCQRGCFLYQTTQGFQGFAVKDFALQSLGPFPLVKRSDLTGALADYNALGSTYNAHEVTGKLGSDFWLGAHTVHWIYQEGGEGSFEKYGGFALGNEEGEVQTFLEIDVTATTADMTLQFSKPFHISLDMWESCENTAPITIASLASFGAQEYCWLVDEFKCNQGCYVYKTTSGYQGFAVKPYAMESLGPFVLSHREDLTDVPMPEENSVTVGNEQHQVAAAATWQLCPDDLPTRGTLGMPLPQPCTVHWAYQATHVTTASQFVGSFEKYGAFIIQGKVWEIGDGDGPRLSFSPPFHLTKMEFDDCTNAGRITLGGLDAHNYCWHTSDPRCPLGCFIYKTPDGYQGFAANRIE